MIKREDLHIRDPFVFVENGEYFLIGTTTADPWGAGSDLRLNALTIWSILPKKAEW